VQGPPDLDVPADEGADELRHSFRDRWCGV
jgi:hypothetical protein